MLLHLQTLCRRRKTPEAFPIHQSSTCNFLGTVICLHIQCLSGQLLAVWPDVHQQIIALIFSALICTPTFTPLFWRPVVVLQCIPGVTKESNIIRKIQVCQFSWTQLNTVVLTMSCVPHYEVDYDNCEHKYKKLGLWSVLGKGAFGKCTEC